MVANSRTVFRTPWFQIVTVNPGAETSTTADPYYCIVRQNGVICLILDSDGNVVLINQYRPPLGRIVLEMPAGGIENGETPTQAAAREILEETGFVCDALIQIAPCRLMLNREDVIEYFFIGLRASESINFRRTEQSTVQVISREQLLKLVVSSNFDQTVALGGIYMAERIFGFDLFQDTIETIESKLRFKR